MTKAKEAGISYEDAAVAFGCNPDTMRKHYVTLDETLIADRVMEAIQGESIIVATQDSQEERAVGKVGASLLVGGLPQSGGGPDEGS